MEKWLNNNAKTKYYYNFTWYNELNNYELVDTLLNHTETHKGGQSKNKLIKKYVVGGKKYGKSYFDIPCSFDIETSTYYVGDEPYSTMYCWQFGINDTVIMGHTYTEFVTLLEQIKAFLKPSKKQRLLVAVHNLAYEFSFIRDWLTITDSFLKEQRRPLSIEHDEFILFIDTLAITQNSLEKTAKNFCNTQKCNGDLDYEKIRVSNLTPMTKEELSYCHNDVLILTEYMRYYNDTYLSKGKRPITATGILNDEVQGLFNEYCEKHESHRAKIQSAQPNESDYNDIMNFCYRGGYTHGRMAHINRILAPSTGYNIMGVDYTSSYPSVMLYRQYPCKMRKALNITTIDDIHKAYKEGYATIFKMTIENVESTTAHSIESKSKCLELVNPVIDNGRVRSCKSMTVYLTMLDLFNYERFYKWDKDSVKILGVLMGKMSYLPSYLIDPMLHYYETKNRLKMEGNEGIEYTTAKARVNSFYGLTVKRVPTERVCYIDGAWTTSKATEYSKQVEKKALVPYYGLFVSAWARYNLLQCVADLEYYGVNCYYMDTDSIKCDDNETSRAYIDNYNANIKRMCEEAKKRTGATDLINGLGEFDIEFGKGTKNGVITKLKILGAKRYILTTDKGKELQTIAGLPKGWLFDKVKEEGHEFYKRDPFEVFCNSMECKECKLTTKYKDAPFTHEVTDYLGNKGIIFEKSCVSLVKIDFQMKLDKVWLALIKNELLNDSRIDGRII